MTARPNDPRRDALRSAAIVVGWHAQASFAEAVGMWLVEPAAKGVSRWQFADGRTIILRSTGGLACATAAARRLQHHDAVGLSLAALTCAKQPARSAGQTLAALGRYVGAGPSTARALHLLFDEPARDRLLVLVDFVRAHRLRAEAFHALVCRYRLDPVDTIRQLSWAQAPAPACAAVTSWRWLAAPTSEDEPLFHVAKRIPIRRPGQPRKVYTANHWRSWLAQTAELLYPHDPALPAVDGRGWWSRHTQELHP